jgi:hypothetical protein
MKSVLSGGIIASHPGRDLRGGETFSFTPGTNGSDKELYPLRGRSGISMEPACGLSRIIRVPPGSTGESGEKNLMYVRSHS